MKAFGSKHRVAWDPFGADAMLSANAAVHGVRDLPEHDLANARYLLSFSGDFLETGISPVHYAREYGRMRGDRETIRGKFIHFGPRLSMTAAAADLFLPCAPGTEGIVALGIAHVMVRDRRTAASAATGRLADDLSAYTPEAVEGLTGVHAHDIAAVAEEFARNQPGIAIPGTGAATGPDGTFHCAAVALLNVLAGNVGKPGGVSFPNRALAFAKYGADAALLAPSPESGYAGMRDAIEKMRGEAFRMAILSGATNPAFTLPPSVKFSEALSKVPFVVAFASFLDETTSQADLVLPVPTALETWGDDLAPVGHSGAVTLCQPVVVPFHDTRSMPDVLIAAAGELGGEPAKALPWRSFKECLDKAYGGPGGEMEAALQRGGFFGESSSKRSGDRTASGALPKATARAIDGDPKAFPLALHLYPSVTLYDGRGANLAWLQEMPDPVTTAVWRNWVEVNPKTGAGLGLSEGDGVTVTSPSGKITAHVTFNPGVAPDVAAMPLGQGHTRYGKTANGRGENPFALLPAGEMYALQATRVSLTKTKLSTRLVRFAHPEGQWKISNLM
jgi:anaerobic selenocysteine-containing dehydrogenase